MGLKNSDFGFGDLVQKTKVDNLPERLLVVFDGLLYVWMSMPSCSFATEEEKLRFIDSWAESFTRVVNEKLNILLSLKKNCKVVVMFDGVTPPLKQRTQSKRVPLPVDRKTLTDKISSTFKANCVCARSQICELQSGEAECEAYFLRNLFRGHARATLIMTEDTDVFHLLYDYPKVHESDKIFVGMKHLNKIYDFSENVFSVPRILVKFLCALSGTDFTSHVISKSMLSNIVNYVKQFPTNLKELNGSPDLAVVKLMLKYVLTVAFRQPCKPCLSSRKSTDVHSYFENVIWTIGYSTHGAAFERFRDSSLEFCDVDPHSVYRFVFEIEDTKLSCLQTAANFVNLNVCVEQLNDAIQNIHCSTNLRMPLLTP
jgi:hypothetical protein